jgi:predicted PurR-regulated permease PerM
MTVSTKSNAGISKARAHPDQMALPSSEVSVSWISLGRIVLAIAAVCLLIMLGKLFELLFLSTLLALALHQIVLAVVRRGGPRWAGVSVATLIVLVFFTLVVGLLLPMLAKQGSALVNHLPDIQKQVVTRLPSSGPLPDIANKLLQSASFSDPGAIMAKFVTGASLLLQAISEFLVMLVIAIYLLIDGDRIFRWLLAFLPNGQRIKVRKASPRIAEIVSRFIVGQSITSALAGTYAFVVLSVLRVPNATLLAVVAAIFDILPILGFFLFIVPAVGIALTVSPMTGGLVALLYGAYHLLETYFIVPKVYGDQLKLSTLTVLLSCMAGWLLGGVVGAVAILPVVASYPVVEKIWLRPLLQKDTVSTHDQIEEEANGEHS